MKNNGKGLNEQELGMYLQKGRMERSDMIVAMCKKAQRTVVKKIKLILGPSKAEDESESA